MRCILQQQKKSIAHKRSKSIFTPMKQVLLNSCFKAYCNYLHHSSTGNTIWLIQTQRKKRVPMQRLPNRSPQHALICSEWQCLRELRLRSRTCRNSPSCSTIQQITKQNEKWLITHLKIRFYIIFLSKDLNVMKNKLI